MKKAGTGAGGRWWKEQDGRHTILHLLPVILFTFILLIYYLSPPPGSFNLYGALSVVFTSVYLNKDACALHIERIQFIF